MLPEKSSRTPMASAKENRKNTKPATERRRRNRINFSLAELKGLLLHYNKKDESLPSKMEKADILEMTVQRLRFLQRQHFSASDSTVMSRHTAGFQECASEVRQFLRTTPEIKPETRTRLLDHLEAYITSPSFSKSSSPRSFSSSPSPPLPAALVSRPSSVSENSSCSFQNKLSDSYSAPPSQRGRVGEVPDSPKTEMFIPKDASSFNFEKTASPETTGLTGVTNGVLSLDPSQIQGSTLNSVQMLTPRIPTCQVAFVLPTNVMTNNFNETLSPQQNYIPVPIYAPSPQGNLTPLTNLVYSSGTLMTLMADETKPGIGVPPMANLTALPQYLSYPGTFSPLSSGAPSCNSTDNYKQFEPSPQNFDLVLPQENNQTGASVSSKTESLSINHREVDKKPPVLQDGQIENVWRPW